MHLLNVSFSEKAKTVKLLKSNLNLLDYFFKFLTALWKAYKIFRKDYKSLKSKQGYKKMKFK